MRNAGWSDTFLKVHMNEIKGLSVSNGKSQVVNAHWLSEQDLRLFVFSSELVAGWRMAVLPRRPLTVWPDSLLTAWLHLQSLAQHTHLPGVMWDYLQVPNSS